MANEVSPPQAASRGPFSFLLLPLLPSPLFLELIPIRLQISRPEHIKRPPKVLPQQIPADNDDYNCGRKFQHRALRWYPAHVRRLNACNGGSLTTPRILIPVNPGLDLQIPFYKCILRDRPP